MFDAAATVAPPSDAPLTPRQDAFARHYAACRNGAEAARRAGYKASNARYAARDNLRRDTVRLRIRALAAAQAEQRRDETVYLLMMLNAAMESALRQDLPNPMIRALALMARMTGLDKPAVKLPAGDDETDGDAALAFADLTAGAGQLQEAVNLAAGPDPHTAPTKHHKTPHPGEISGKAGEPPAERGGVPRQLEPLCQENDVAPALSRGPSDGAAAETDADDAWAPDRPSAVRGDTEPVAPQGQSPARSPDVAPALSRGPSDGAVAETDADDAWAPDRPSVVRGDTEPVAPQGQSPARSPDVAPALSRGPRSGAAADDVWHAKRVRDGKRVAA